MASTSISSQKTTTSISTLSTTSRPVENTSNSERRDLPNQSSSRNSLEDEDDQASSGDEWDMEIGNLIIDLDADLEKDEMKEKGCNSKNDIRNSNNNNSLKESNNTTGDTMNSSSKLISGSLQTATKNEVVSGTKIYKNGTNTISSTPSSGKTKSKSKKSKNAAVNKLGNMNISLTTSAVSKCDLSDVGSNRGFSPLPATNVAVGKGKSSENTTEYIKSSSKASKSSRGYKKHKNMNSEKKPDAQSTSVAGNNLNKDGREKAIKPGKGNKQLIQDASFNSSISTTSMTTFSSDTKIPSSSQYPTTKFPNHCATTSTDILSKQSSHCVDKQAISRSNEAPVMSAVPHLGNHRKTCSVPSPMKFQTLHGKPNVVSSAQYHANAPTPHVGLLLATTAELSVGQYGVSGGKRDRNSASSSISVTTKKIKLEKEGKSYNSGMTPTDGDNVAKPTSSLSSSNITMSTAVLSLPGNYMTLNSTAGDYKMACSSTGKSDKTSLSSTRTALSSVSTNSQSSAKTKLSHAETPKTVIPSAVRAGTNLPQNDLNNSGPVKTSTRTVGTDTTYADVGVATEPESLGPCDPGTCVNLSGIVWHETESGVLVVNVTWRNRSYVGTLLDATKHDWAPPRIPDVDSDVEYRIKSGRPKRQRGNGNNGSGADSGRKGRKSMVNNGDEYKCSPSSNKRRSAKISESEAYSGNDGEICTTPSKSAKRPRMSRNAKQTTQKTSNTAIAKEATSGDGTSGSGSSACSSPVFMECSYANCEKRYKDNNALKYHEVHAHPERDVDDIVNKSPEVVDSPEIDSPKDSGNLSSKSEEMSVSDSTGSPNDNNSLAAAAAAAIAAPETNLSYQTAMDTSQSQTSTEIPFVVTQPAVTTAAQKQYETTSYPNLDVAPEKGIINEYSINKNVESSKPKDRSISPYTLTDSQSNDSISLKTHVPSSVSSRQNHNTRPTTTYADSISRQTTSLTDAAAVSESDLAVKTLLQLQDSQDQLPGLTSYQSSQPQSVTSQIVSTTAPVSINASMQLHCAAPVSSINTDITGSPVSDVNSASSLKPQSLPGSPFRAHGHSKENTQLPRMSVGISAPRNSGSSNGQFVSFGGYPAHGTVTANTTQEGMAHFTSTGLKTVKGKTVPIPTDPQQTITAAQQSTNVTPSSAASLKKQKRKKPKGDMGKYPTDTAPKSSFSHPTPRPSAYKEELKQAQIGPDSVGVKQEHLPFPTSYNKMHTNLPVGKPPSASATPMAVSVKVEPDSRILTGPPHHSRGSEFLHANVQAPSQRPHIHALGGLDMPPSAQLPISNKNKFAPTPRSQESSSQPQVHRHSNHQSHAASPAFSDASDKSDSQLFNRGRFVDVRSKDHSNAPSVSSHSLPGSRSLTPVSQVPRHQPTSRQYVSSNKDPNSQLITHPNHRRPPSNKESGSPPPPLERRLSVEGAHDHNKQGPMMSQRTAPYPTYGQYRIYPGPDMASYHMSDPQFQQHYENVIQQVMQRDHIIKEEQMHSTRMRSTPSPNPLSKPLQAKSPPRHDERRPESPNRGQQFSQTNVQFQHGYRTAHGSQQHSSGHHQPPPRISPAPQGSYPPTPNKLGSSGQASARGISPHQYASPSPMAGNRPPRPSSEAERFHRREQGFGDRPPTNSRMSTLTPGRKPVPKENFPEQRTQSPEKEKPGLSPTSIYASPGMPMQGIPPGARPPVQYYPATSFPPQMYDQRHMPPFAFPAYAMFPPGAPIFPGHWPQHGAQPSAVQGVPDKPPSQSPHLAKPPRERSSSGSRSPYRDEGERRLSRGEVRGREGDSYSSSKEMRSSDGPGQIRKSITPDPKVASIRNPSGDGKSGTSTPPTQRHHHTHHHIHEGFAQIISPQYPYPMAPAVMAGPEAAAAIVQFPNKRDLP